jgi:two-component system, OmpR family, phosphate regulon response regulator PhoB
MAANMGDAVAVLVVDDDTIIREGIRAALEDSGYVVYEAPDGRSAIDRLRTSPAPLVVLLDWMMPGIDGMQVLRALHRDSAAVQRHAYLLMTAALDDPPIADLSLPVDVAIDVLRKPFDLDDLLTSVAQMATRLTPNYIGQESTDFDQVSV